MNKQFMTCLAAIVAMTFSLASLHAEVYAYRLVKVVSPYGEETVIQNGKKVYINFTANKGSFYISMENGSRAGLPKPENGYASGFANQVVPARVSGIGRNEPADPIDFRFKRTTDRGIHIYEVSRPVRALDVISHVTYIAGYVNDYAQFSNDFSRINVKLDKDKGYCGMWPFAAYSDYEATRDYTFVFEQVRKVVPTGEVFY